MPINKLKTTSIEIDAVTADLIATGAITVGAPLSPSKTFTISGGISSQVGYFGSTDYTSWFFDVD